MSIEKTVQKLNYIYYSFFVLAIAAASLGFKFMDMGTFIDDKSETGIALSSILILIIIGAVPLTLRAFNKHLQKINAMEVDEAFKVKAYEKASVIRILIMGSGLIIGVLAFYLMQSKSMLFCAGISAIGLFFAKPALVKLITDLKLHEEEEDTVEDIEAEEELKDEN